MSKIDKLKKENDDLRAQIDAMLRDGVRAAKSVEPSPPQDETFIANDLRKALARLVPDANSDQNLARSVASLAGHHEAAYYRHLTGEIWPWLRPEPVDPGRHYYQLHAPAPLTPAPVYDYTDNFRDEQLDPRRTPYRPGRNTAANIWQRAVAGTVPATQEQMEAADRMRRDAAAGAMFFGDGNRVTMITDEAAPVPQRTMNAAEEWIYWSQDAVADGRAANAE